LSGNENFCSAESFGAGATLQRCLSHDTLPALDYTDG